MTKTIENKIPVTENREYQNLKQFVLTINFCVRLINTKFFYNSVIFATQSSYYNDK